MPLCRWMAIALVLLAAASTGLAKERVWTSTDGRTIRGEFVRELDGEVTFLVAGKLVTFAIDRLTEADQQKVRDLAAGKEIPDDAVPAPATATTDESKPAAPPTESAAPGALESAAEPAKPADVPSLTRKPRTAPALRVWTDNQGRQSTARFVRVFGSKVVLSRGGTTPITVDYFELSAADQAYIRDLLTSRGEEELIPPEPLAESATSEDADRGQPRPDSQPAADTGDGTIAPVGPGAGRGPGSRIRGPGSGRIGGPGMGPRGPGMSGVGPPAVGPSGPGFDSRPPGTDSGSGRGSGFGPGFGPGGFGPGSRVGPDSALGNGPTIAPAPGSDGSGLSSAPSVATTPPYTPPPIAYQPASPPALPTFTQVPMCSSCRNQVTEEQAKGTTCPHCGAQWQFNQYASATGKGSSKSGAGMLPMSSAEAEKTVRTVVLVVAILGGVVVLVGGIIIAALAIASASRPRRQPTYRPYH